MSQSIKTDKVSLVGGVGGDVIDTAYGRAKIISRSRSSDGKVMFKCTPVSWVLAQGCRPTFFLNQESISPALLREGDCVKCQYGGVGRIVEVREDDYVVSLDNWKLAQGQSPKLYLSLAALKLWTELDIQEEEQSKGAQEKRERERLAHWRESLIRAAAVKNAGGDLYKKKSYEEARSKYQEALAVLDKIGERELMPDDIRAEVFETTTPCHNNMARCYLMLQQFPEALGFARNGLMLAKAMQSRIGSGLFKELVARGVTESKLIKDWMRTSLYLLAKAQMGMKDCDEAYEHFDAALKLVEGDKEYEKVAAELVTSRDEALKERKKELKKSQKIWGAAFEKSKQEDEEKEKQAKASPRKSAPGNGSSADKDTPRDNKAMADSVVSKFMSSAVPDASPKKSDGKSGKGSDTGKKGSVKGGAREEEDIDDDDTVTTMITVGLVSAAVVGLVALGARLFFGRKSRS